MSELPNERAAEHLDAAENYLVIAEDANNAITGLHAIRHAPVQIGEGEDEPAPDWYDRKQAMSDAFENAAQLGELHRRMAETIWRQPRELTVFPSMDEMSEHIRAKMAEDEAEYQGARLRPGIDPEPAEDGALWTIGDGWFYYATEPANGTLAPAYTEAPRWLLVRHYAQFLRWKDEKGYRPIPARWREVGDSVRHDGVEHTTFRRPTAEERTTFFGPEPDPTPAPEALLVNETAGYHPNTGEPTGVLSDGTRVHWNAELHASPAAPGAACGACESDGLNVAAVVLNPRGWPRCAYHHASESRAAQR